jgi:hypothetical protein
MMANRAVLRAACLGYLVPGRADWVLSKSCDPQLESKLRFSSAKSRKRSPYVRHFRMSVLWF